MIKILFVCLGNICRSPMAEGLFRHKIKLLGLQHLIQCDSAGTANYHVGDLPDHRTLKVLADNRVNLDHRGRQAIRSDAQTFDYILAMDSANYRDLQQLLPGDFKNLFLMRHFDTHAPGTGVPDPYYGDIRDFEETYQILDHCLDNFIDHIRKTHQL